MIKKDENKRALFYVLFILLLLLMVFLIRNTFIKKVVLWDNNSKNSTEKIEENNMEEIKITKGIKHSIILSEIISGGVSKDAIAPIDKPIFVKGHQSILNNNDSGIGLTDQKGKSYFLPFRILVWHEIVNMKISYNDRDDFPIAVTYCPLCRTGIAFESVVDGQDKTFGTSGKLWQSNLLMYDRSKNEKEESLWSQVLGQAVIGPKTGTKLKIYSSSITSYKEWMLEHKDSVTLSTETGYKRDYNKDPYGPSYYTGEETYFPINFDDNENSKKEIVIGLEIDGNFLAYKKKGLKEINDTFGNNFINITKKKDGGLKILVNDEEHQFIEGFWFSWKSAHPSTILK